MNEIIKLNKVHKEFSSKKITDNVSFDIFEGDICGFIGPNGAGKTTIIDFLPIKLTYSLRKHLIYKRISLRISQLLSTFIYIKMINGLITPTKGEIFMNGINVVKNRKKALREVGAIVEETIFFNYMSGRKNLQNLAKLNTEMNRKEQLEKVEEVLEIVGLKTKNSDRGDDKVKTYSLGMKDLRELILKLKEKYGITFFISSHLLDELQKICNRYLIIKEGG